MSKCPVSTLRSWLEKPTARIAKLAIHRGFPVPFFVDYIKGVPEFRAMARHKYVKCVQKRLCWVCGEPLDFNATFVIGPMCAINRVSSEPPSHLECARYSAKNCPFLNSRQMERREDETTEGMKSMGGVGIKRNPGVTLLWTTPTWNLFSDGQGGVLIRVGDPIATEWWSHARLATRQEVVDSVAAGLPALSEPARQEGPAAILHLLELMAEAEKLYPSQ